MSVEVLFVDDEPDVLEGIENHLYAIRSSWRARFAHSGDEALALLDRRTADVVVSDMRMPGMDGATLLAKVRQQNPSAVRIILSGETGAKGFLRAAACAHQVLAKPCDIAALQRLVTETLALQRQLADPDLVAAINQLTVLPCLPAISARLEDVLRDERSFTQDVVDLLEQDPAIVCRILHVANSPFFRGAGEVTDLHSAVTRLGHDLIRGLV
ncbi:MAG: response regulator, partial [Xanthomonadaceae bacterium]|nr:response regulator [Xanthomonadaceae bacterium]